MSRIPHYAVGLIVLGVAVLIATAIVGKGFGFARRQGL